MSMNRLSSALSLSHASATTLALTVAVGVALPADAALVNAAEGGCTVTMVNLTDRCEFLKDLGGLDIEVRCGAGVTITNGQQFSVGGSVNFAPGGVGGSVNWSCTFVTAVAFTIAAENCEFCKGELCLTNQKVKVTVCPGFWPWSDPKVDSQYIAGNSAVTEECRSDAETRCYCKRKGKKCPCGIDTPPSASESDLGSGTVRGAVSFEYAQVRGADLEDRMADGLEDMCMLDVALFRRFFESTDLEATTLDVAVIGSTGSIEMHAVDSFLEKLAAREAALVDGARLDVNEDGVIGDEDLMIVLKSLGATVEGDRFDYRADLDGNGKVSDEDLDILQGWL